MRGAAVVLFLALCGRGAFAADAKTTAAAGTPASAQVPSAGQSAEGMARAENGMRAVPAKRVIKPLPGEEVVFKTRDGWTLIGDYLAAQPGKPTVLLLHDGVGRRQDWRPLAARMKKRGLGYFAWDLRGHGGSQNPPEGQPAQWNKFVVSKTYNEWDSMREDVVAALALLQEKGVSSGTIVLGGADVGANIALKYAAVHPEIARVFLLSPSLNYREVLTVNAMRAYRGRPILIVLSEDDRRFTTEAGLLFTFAKASVGDALAGMLRVKSKHGTKMLPADRTLADRILDWVEDPVPPAAEVVASTSSVSGGSDEAGAAASGDGLPDEAELGRRVSAPEPVPAQAVEVAE